VSDLLSRCVFAPVPAAPAVAAPVAESGPSRDDLVAFVRSEADRRGPGFFRDMAARGATGWSPNMRAAIVRAFEKSRAAAAPVPVALADPAAFAGVVAFFAGLRAAGVKRPKIRLEVAGVGRIALSVAGPGSRVPGALNVAEDVPFGSGGRWFGRILPSGEFDPGRDDCAAVRELVAAFAADPRGVAVAFGRLTGACFACALPLSDPRSISAGYGEKCASKLGWPWGAVGESPLLCAPA
jgi:hypothetical protein